MTGGTLFHIIAAAFGMTIAVVGIAFATGYFHVSNPKLGYPFIIIGGFLTFYYLSKLRRD